MIVALCCHRFVNRRAVSIALAALFLVGIPHRISQTPYDIEADWAETTNVAGANPDVVNELIKKMLAWKRSLPTEPPAHCFSRLRTEQRK